MYHQLASHKNLMTKDQAILEKKLKRKSEKIRDYEQQLSVTRDQVAQLRNKIRELSSMLVHHYDKDKLSKVTDSQAEDFDKLLASHPDANRMSSITGNSGFMFGMANAPNHSYQQRIVKSIRGGGGRKPG